MEEIILNQWGTQVFKNKTNKHVFLEKPYGQSEHMTILDESEGRLVVGCGEYSTFDFTDWEPITKAEYAKVKQRYTDIYGLITEFMED